MPAPSLNETVIRLLDATYEWPVFTHEGGELKVKTEEFKVRDVLRPDSEDFDGGPLRRMFEEREHVIGDVRDAYIALFLQKVPDADLSELRPYLGGIDPDQERIEELRAQVTEQGGADADEQFDQLGQQIRALPPRLERMQAIIDRIDSPLPEYKEHLQNALILDEGIDRVFDDYRKVDHIGRSLKMLSDLLDMQERGVSGANAMVANQVLSLGKSVGRLDGIMKNLDEIAFGDNAPDADIFPERFIDRIRTIKDGTQVAVGSIALIIGVIKQIVESQKQGPSRA